MKNYNLKEFLKWLANEIFCQKRIETKSHIEFQKHKLILMNKLNKEKNNPNILRTLQNFCYERVITNEIYYNIFLLLETVKKVEGVA